MLSKLSTAGVVIYMGKEFNFDESLFMVIFSLFLNRSEKKERPLPNSIDEMPKLKTDGPKVCTVQPVFKDHPWG